MKVTEIQPDIAKLLDRLDALILSDLEKDLIKVFKIKGV